MAYFWRSNPGPFLWPVVFIIAAGLIVYGTRQDVSSPTAWLLLLPRFVVGWAFLEGKLPLSERVLMVSGRVSFEIVQKAAMGGVPIVCAVSAPSSLAVEAAEDLGMTVVGFVRDGGFNVYTHPERLDLGN